MKILLIESDAEVIIAEQSILESFGYSVEVAKTSETAVEKIEHGKFDIIFANPGCLNPEERALIRRSANIAGSYGKLPLLVACAKDFQDYEKIFYTLAADDFIIKPLTKQKIKNVVERLGDPF